ncbi:M56 family metallopeptidase [Actinosynnema sp. NPDC059797]
MTIAVALLLGAWLVAWLAPRHLRRLTSTGTDPRVALVAWLSSAVSVVATAGLAVAALLLPDHGSHVFAAFHTCLASLAHGTTPRVEAMAGAVGVLLLAALLVRLVVLSARAARRRARTRREHLSVLRLAARREGGSPDTLWLEHEEPVAFSLAGSPGVVVATDGLVRRLTGEQVRAVLAHERAHLRGRHHLLVAAGDAVATLLPFLPLFRRTPGAVRELVELAADAAAAQTCGADAVRTALTRVTGCGAPGSALAMSRDAVEVRLAHLQHADRRRGPVRTLLSCGLTGLTTMVLPPLTALSGLLALVTLSCS